MNPCKPIYKFILVFLVIAHHSFAQINFSDSLPVVELTSTETYREIGNLVDVLEDPSNQLTIKDIQSAQYNALFFRGQQSTLNFSFSRSGFWIRFRLKSNATITEKWLVETGNATMSNIELFSIHQDGITTIQKNGVKVAIEDREVKEKLPMFNLNILPAEEQTIYIHIAGNDNKLMRLAIWEKERYISHVRQYDIVLALYFGIFLALIFYNLFLYFSIFDIEYLYYVLFITGVMFTELSATGFGFYQIGPFFFNEYSLWIYFTITFIFSTLFSIKFLNIKEYYPLLNKIFINYTVFFALILIVVLLSINQWYLLPLLKILAFSVIANVILLFTASIMSMKKGYRPARYFLIGWSVLFIAIFVIILKHMNYLPINWFTNYFMKLATTFEMIVLSFGLADRFHTVSMKLKFKTIESQQFAESEKMKSDFFSNISHEFRTPLALILSPLERIIQNSRGNNLFTKQHHLMYRNAKRLLQLVNQLLYLTKLDSKAAKLKIRNEDLGKELSFIASYFESLAEEKQITFHTSFPSGDSLIVPFDKEKLEMIIFNLLSNAFKFTPSGEQVSLSVSAILSAKKISAQIKPKDNQLIRISIKDSGIGIPADQLDKIFDRFYQVNNSTVREYEGTGIGLSLVRELVNLHRGQLEVTSEAGKGSEFIILLPADHLSYHPNEFATETEVIPSEIAYSHIIPDSAIEKPISLTSKDERDQVLIVEDNADFRSFTRSILEDEYEVIEAADGESGWKLAQEKIPDLIVSDLMMPKMDGLGLCKNVKEDIRTSHIPVILLTARQAIDYKLKGLETGADDYLSKPFHVQELQIRIKNLIALREKLKDKYNKPTSLLNFDVPVTSANEKFLQLLTKVIEDNLTSSDFDMELLSREVGMSRVQLFRKLKALTGQAPSDFIRIYKLNKAANLLSKKAFESISEVAYACGFNSPSYFTETFRKQFGKSPSEFIKNE